jgi:hypothetical protein
LIDNFHANRSVFDFFQRENIDAFTPSNKEKLTAKLMWFKPEIPSKQIVKNVNGVARPGDLMAIMVNYLK